MRTLSHSLAAFAAAAALVLVAAAPASAHDELLTSDPAPGDAVAVAPEEIVLTFSSDVMSVGAAIIVADADGTDWVGGDPVMDGTVVTVPLQSDMPESGYEVRWRVVSSDGHPISGIIPFTVGDAAPIVRESAPATSGDAGSENAQGATSDEQAWRPLIVAASGAALAAAAFALILILRRRSRPARLADDSTSPSERANTP